MLIECWANMAPMIANAMPVVGDEKEYCKEMNIPLSFAINMRIIGGIFQYMVNSTSWREGKLLDFDKHELNSKMKGIKF
jgi:hypothetical protein